MFAVSYTSGYATLYLGGYEGNLVSLFSGLTASTITWVTPSTKISIPEGSFLWGFQLNSFILYNITLSLVNSLAILDPFSPYI